MTTTGGFEPGPSSADSQIPRRRLKGFALHLIVYFAVMMVAVPVNFMTTPENPWFVLPMIGWGAVLAVHVAFVMGLFRGLFGGLTGKSR